MLDNDQLLSLIRVIHILMLDIEERLIKLEAKK